MTPEQEQWQLQPQTPAIHDALQYAFIQNVSHELRTPVALIHGCAELLYGGDIGALRPEQQKLISIILSRTHELRGLVERISALLAIQARALVRQPFRLTDLAQRAVESYRAAAHQAGVAVSLDADPGLEPLWGDPYYIEQAVLSLLDNAVKFTPQGGRVDIAVFKEKGWQCLAVTDTGIGIPEEEHQRIFMRFYQVDGSATRRYGGVGLGLALAKETVEAHGGTIEVESQVGQGSRFTLRLPAGVRTDPDRPTERGTLGARRILIVDDEESVVLTFRCSLETLPNCEVATATSASEALRLASEGPLDLLITDYKMPDMDGVTLASRIRALHSQIAIIMITAYGDDALREMAAALPVQRVLDKPVGIRDIRSTVTQLLADD